MGARSAMPPDDTINVLFQGLQLIGRIPYYVSTANVPLLLPVKVPMGSKY